MKCPYCGHEQDRVLDSRPLDGASVIRRRRECQSCHKRFTTYERLENVPLMVSKSDGRLELFNREKLREGISRSLEKRPVPAGTVERLVSEIEYEMQDYLMQVPSHVIGEKVLQKLLNTDHVAYIRFASVYRQFPDADAFLIELEKLKKSGIKPQPDFHPGRGRKSLKIKKAPKENKEKRRGVFMIKSDRWIIQMAKQHAMIDPFEPKQVKEVRTPSGMKKVISYGTSSYGYDIRVDNLFKVLDPALQQNSAINDPKDFDFTGFKEYKGDTCLIPPHGMAIVQSLEHFRIPREVLVICQGKSTYARCGIQVSIAPLEPEWEGRLTFSITNTSGRPARIYAHEGIAQILFLESDEVCQVSYADKAGKYQQSTTLTPPKV